MEVRACRGGLFWFRSWREERNELIVRPLARQPARSSFGFNSCESHHRGGLLRWTKIPRSSARIYKRARLMPVNVTLGRHLWEAEVVWERRRFWMDASKAAARKSADMGGGSGGSSKDLRDPENRGRCLGRGGSSSGISMARRRLALGMEDPLAADIEILVSAIVCFVDFTRPGCEEYGSG